MFPEGQTAVDETPLETGAESTELATDVQADGAEGGDPGQDGAAAPDAQAAGASAWPVIDGKALSPAAKQYLEDLKAKDPVLAKHLRSALFQADAMRRELPGGLKEVQQLRQTIEDLGGETGLSAMRQETEEWRALDQKFTAGDPNFLSQITETPEGKQSFLQLAPHAVELFSQLNPEGYSSYFAQVFTNHLYQQGVTLAFQRLGDFLNGNEQAVNLWKQIGGYFNGLADMAKKPVAPPAPTRQPDTDQRAQQLEQREQQLMQKEWNTSRMDIHKSIFDPEFARLTAGRKVSEQQRAAIFELCGSRLRSALSALPGHKDKVDRYAAARDADGYSKYFKAVYAAEIPKALRAAVDVILPGAKPGPKPGAPAAPVASAAAPKPGAPQTPGFQFVAQMPKASELSRQTTPDMIRQGRAILQDGRKVQWRRAQA